MSQSDSLEALYPLLIFVAIPIIKALKAHAKKKQEEKERVQSIRAVAPAPPIPKRAPLRPVEIKNVKPIALSKVVKKEVFHRKKRPRIANLVGGLRSKKSLILLSEILVNKEAIK